MNKIHLAWKIAKKVHKNQKRYNGRPYINHIKEVVGILEQMEINVFYNEHIIEAAILHDVIEDGGIEYRDKILDNFSVYVLVDILTHRKSYTYEEYIKRILTNKDAVVIKIADMIQNLTENPTKKQREKYRKALPLLIKKFGEN